MKPVPFCRTSWWFVAFLAFTAFEASADAPKRVLIVHSFLNAAPPFTVHSTAFESTLTAEMRGRVDLDEVSLDVARYATWDMDEALVEYLAKRHEKWKPDLVVPIGSPAGVFVARYRDRLFPATPVLYAGMDSRRLPPDALQSNAAFVGESFDFGAMVEDMLQVAPTTTNIVVVLGASQLEQYWAAAIQREWMPFTNRVSFTWLNDLTFEQMLERVSHTPPHSFIFLVLLMRDASGVTHNADEALRRIHAVANAPVNSIFQYQLGMGIVGGRLYQAEQEGVESARIAIRILHGEAAARFPPKIIGALGPQYDWQELRRWNIREADLPPGSIVKFRQPTIWQLYSWQVAAVLSAIILQGLAFSALFIQWSRRRKAEKLARDFSGRLIHAQEEERARLARELHDDITQRLARLAIDTGRAEREGVGRKVGATMREVREGLVKLSEDVHGLSYRLHPSLIEDLGLGEALKAECDRVARSGSCPAKLIVRELPAGIPSDVALCVYRITQESLRNASRHAKASSVEVIVRGWDGGLQLAIRDDGIGFDPEVIRERHSLGLAGMRERLRLVGGDLDIESAAGHGTTIVAWLPLNGSSK